MILPVDIGEQISKSPLNGVSCRFVKIDDDWGIKGYKKESVRDGMFNNQVLLSEYELSPPVGDKMNIGAWFCYTTRIAEVLIDPTIDYFDDLWDETEEIWQDEIDKLKNNIRLHTGKLWEDDHVGNVGIFNFHEHSKLVCIDLGLASDGGC